MDRKSLKDKYNSWYKEFKKKEFYQLSQFDKLFILLLDMLDAISNIKLTNTIPDNVSTNTLTSKTLEIVFNNGYCSNNFTLPSTDCLLITPKLDKDITVQLQIAYKDTFVDTDMWIDITKDTNKVVQDFSSFKAIVNKKDSCRLCSNESLSTTFVLYYV